jgi:hypothetical protein
MRPPQPCPYRLAYRTLTSARNHKWQAHVSALYEFQYQGLGVKAANFDKRFADALSTVIPLGKEI